HRLCESRDFRAAKPANPGGHQPGRHLVIGNFSASVTRNQKIDFFARVFSRIALLPNQVYGSHGRKIVAVPRRCVKSESKQIPRCAWNDKGGISGRTSGVGRPRRRRKRAAPPTLGKESAAGARSGSSGGSRRHCRRGEFSRHRQNTATRAQTV